MPRRELLLLPNSFEVEGFVCLLVVIALDFDRDGLGRLVCARIR